MGDSITYGYLASSSAKNYPSQLGELLGDRFEVENYGVNCAAMLRTGDGDYRKTLSYQRVLASNATDVVVMLGHNDGTWRNWGLSKAASSSASLALLSTLPGLSDDDACKAAYNNATLRWQQWRDGRSQLPIDDGSEATEWFRRDFSDLVTSFRAMPSRPNVFLVLPPPLYTDGAYTMNKTLINAVLPRLLRRIASESLALPPIDAYSPFAARCDPASQHWCDWTVDGCHPNDHGYLQLASGVAEALHRACPAGQPTGRSVSLSAEPRPPSAWPSAEGAIYPRVGWI